MSSDRAVPMLRPLVSLDEIKVGAPVRAATWADISRLMMWVRGRGRCLVPAGLSLLQVRDSTSETLRYRCHPSGVAIDRVWVVSARSASNPSISSPALQFTLQAGAGPVSPTYTRLSYDFTDRDSSPPVVYIEEGVTKTNALTELTLTVAVPDVAGVDKFMEVTSVGCWELPRGQLSKTAADLGISLDSIYPRRPIYEASYEGIQALAAPLAEPVRRVGLFAQWHQEAETSSGSYVDTYDLPVPVVPSKDLIGATTRTCSWDVYARASDGTTGGDIRITTDTGATATLTVPVGATTGAWRGPGTISIRCEDLSTSDGVPGGTYPTIQIAARRTAGAGKIHWRGECVWES